MSYRTNQDLDSWLESSYRPETWTGLFMYLDEIRAMLELLETDNRQALVLLAAIEALAQTATRDTP